ncbi:hypothetical protein GCM10028784_18540 [Myceligenerans cantabricum]
MDRRDHRGPPAVLTDKITPFRPHHRKCRNRDPEQFSWFDDTLLSKGQEKNTFDIPEKKLRGGSDPKIGPTAKVVSAPPPEAVQRPRR